MLSVDVMDISGETQTDISHNVVKTRLTSKGEPLQALSASNELRNDLDKINEQRGDKYCGSCFGGKAPESGCCNTCESVRQAYLDRGWSFNRPDSIEQVHSVHRLYVASVDAILVRQRRMVRQVEGAS